MSRKLDEIAARWGLPIEALIRDFANQGFSQAGTARALGYTPRTFWEVLNRGDLPNPWKRQPSKVVEYVTDTGEPFRDAVRRLAATHHINAAARELGFASAENLRIAMRNRGIDATFQVYQRPRKQKREPSVTPISAAEVDRYLRLRQEEKPASYAAMVIGRQRAALWRAAKRLRPANALELQSAYKPRKWWQDEPLSAKE